MALPEADYSLTDQALGSQQAAQGFMRPGDETLAVKFFIREKENQQKSAEAGRPIYDDTEYVSIMVPGQKDNIVERPATRADKERFAAHYAAFKNRQEQRVEGTPLSSWPALSKSQVAELKFFNVHTVEQLAEVSDANAQGFMGLASLRTKAKMFLEAAQDTAYLTKMAAELEQRDNRIATLEQAMEAQGLEVQELKRRLRGQLSDSGSDAQPSSGGSRPRTGE